MKHAEELHERILSFDSRITIPPDFGTEGNEFDKDGPNQLDLVKAGRGRLSGAALAIFGWPEMWNGPNAPHKPTPGFVDEARHQQEIRYKILTGMVRDFPNQVGIAYSPEDFRRLAMEGKFAIVMSMLNAYPLGDDLSQLDKWAARGVRMFGFNYVGNNDWSDSSVPCRSSTTRRMPWAASPARQAGGRTAQRSRGDHRRLADVDQGPGTGRRPQPRAHRRLALRAARPGGHQAQPQRPRDATDQGQRRRDPGGRLPAYLRPLSEPTLDKLNALRARFDLPPLEGLDYALMPGDPIITIWPEQRFGEYASALYGILEEEPKAGLKELVDAIDYTVKKVGIDHVGMARTSTTVAAWTAGRMSAKSATSLPN